jgi:hypothetical protein
MLCKEFVFSARYTEIVRNGGIFLRSEG